MSQSDYRNLLDAFRWAMSAVEKNCVCDGPKHRSALRVLMKHNKPLMIDARKTK